MMAEGGFGEVELENGSGPGVPVSGLDSDGCAGEAEDLLAPLRRFPQVHEVVSQTLIPKGFEVYVFHIGWYNELVGPRFYLDYDPNTVALVVLSGPDTFEKCVVPFIKAQVSKDTDLSTFDPLDGSMRHTFSLVTAELRNTGFEVDPIQDFEYHPNRKPKVLVQTAAHVAGAVEYFHRDRLQCSSKAPDWLEESKLYGVAIHPNHGGWFAIRGVLILKNLVLKEGDLLRKPPRPINVEDKEKIATLLEEFGLRWKNNEWRDIIPGKLRTKYSENFIDYLATEPAYRWEFMKSRGLFPELDANDRTI